MRHAIERLCRLVAADVRTVAREAWFARHRPRMFTLDGVVLELGPWATEAIRQAVLDGSYERPERRIVESTLHPGDVVLELGAGMGYVTTVAARIARAVRSFDANPELARVAHATVLRNGLTADVTNGVLARAPTAERVAFYVGQHFTDASLLSKPGAHRIDVPLLDFTQACEGASYLIADIEGGEVELLSDTILPSVRAICVECHPAVVSSRAITGMLQSLFEQGFALDLGVSEGQVLYLERG